MYQHIIKVGLARPVNQRGRHARHANGQPCGLRRVMDQVVALAFMPPNEISKTCNRILYIRIRILQFSGKKALLRIRDLVPF